jgi:prepilin peptidase CpaA
VVSRWLFLSLVEWGLAMLKLMTAIGCIAGVSSLQVLLISIAIAGAVFGIAVSIYFGRLRETLSNVNTLLAHHSQQGLKPHPDLNLDNPGTLRLPFALPIAAGCLVTLCSLVMGGRP